MTKTVEEALSTVLLNNWIAMMNSFVARVIRKQNIAAWNEEEGMVL